MFDTDFDDIFWNEYDEDEESYWDNANNENFKNNKNEIKMNELICTNPKNYKLTLDKKYLVITNEGDTVMIINDNNKSARYYKDLFIEVEEEVIPEPEPVIVRTEQDLIDSIASNGTQTTYVDFDNQIIAIGNKLNILNNDSDFSCGIKNVVNIGDQINEIYETIAESSAEAEEDLPLLTKAVVNHHFKNYIIYKSNDGYNGGIYLMSCNTTGGGLDEEVVAILDEISDFNTVEELNPNSGNQIKLWGFYKSNLNN